eukprot:TRINITY_DN3322_c0_g1_i2.p1 TRINITY_DN3322_c0_g1~~TRINITY_DN3322_c0_g1_i2.p1  ORF type:complete len:627 (+),score=137.28 TRINITY_DN3322_c0_g1_i2:42-1883(+)
MTTVAQATEKAFLGALKKPKNEKKVRAAFDLVDQDKDGKHVLGEWTTEVMVGTFKAIIEGLIHEPKKNNVSAALKSVLASFFSSIDYADLAETLFNMTDIDKKGYLEYDDFQAFVLHWSTRKDEFLISALTIKQLQSDAPKEFILNETQQTQLEVLEKLHKEGLLTKLQLEKQKGSLGLCPVKNVAKARKERRLKAMEARPRAAAGGNPTRGTIKVQLMEARQLPTHKFGQPNSYAVMSTTWPLPSFQKEERRNSTTCKNTTEPAWNDTFTFAIDSSTDVHTLTINLWDSQMFGLLMNLGYVSFQVVDIVKSSLAEPAWYPLKNSLKKESQGEIRLSITWEERVIKKQEVTKLDLQTKILSAREYFSPRGTPSTNLGGISIEPTRASSRREPSVRDREAQPSVRRDPSLRDREAQPSVRREPSTRGKHLSSPKQLESGSGSHAVPPHMATDRDRRRTFAPGAFSASAFPEYSSEGKQRSGKRYSEKALKLDSTEKKINVNMAGTMKAPTRKGRSSILGEDGHGHFEPPTTARTPIQTLESTLAATTRSLQEERQLNRLLAEKLEQLKEEKDELHQKLSGSGHAPDTGNLTCRTTESSNEEWSQEKNHGLSKGE